MNTSDRRPLQGFLNGSAQEADDWLRASVISLTDLQLLADEISNHALSIRAADRDTALAWAMPALHAYERVADEHDDFHQRDRALRDAMRLRAAFVSTFGERPDHELLDSNPVFDWFLAERTDDIDHVTAMATNWQTIPLKDLDTLVRLKASLGVLRLIAGSTRYWEPDIQQWVRLTDVLP